MNHLTGQQLEALRSKLIEERNDLRERLIQRENYGLADALGETTGELSAYDNHPADLGTEVYERGKDIALNENDEKRLHEIEDALARIANGAYGICAVSGEPIPFERLEAVPATKYALEHVPDPHISSDRPIEESFMQPPFGRTSLDEQDDQVQFDGEDAWQIVESWGTSNSPAMAENGNVDDYNEMDIEADEASGYVEPIESFLATDITGQVVSLVRNRQYKQYIANGEGARLLEPAETYDIEETGEL